MSMDTREIAALAAVLTLNANAGLRPHEIASDVVTLKRLAARALTRSLRMCNDSNYPEAKQERDRASIMKAAGAALANYKIKGVSVGGDPRSGSALTIEFIDGSTNSFGTDGWAL